MADRHFVGLSENVAQQLDDLLKSKKGSHLTTGQLIPQHRAIVRCGTTTLTNYYSGQVVYWDADSAGYTSLDEGWCLLRDANDKTLTQNRYYSSALIGITNSLNLFQTDVGATGTSYSVTTVKDVTWNPVDCTMTKVRQIETFVDSIRVSIVEV